MEKINHLPESEQQHYGKCPDWGHYFDMRDLADVFSHEHDKKVPDVPKNYRSKRVGDNVEYLNGKDPINLN